MELIRLTSLRKNSPEQQRPEEFNCPLLLRKFETGNTAQCFTHLGH